MNEGEGRCLGRYLIMPGLELNEGNLEARVGEATVPLYLPRYLPRYLPSQGMCLLCLPSIHGPDHQGASSSARSDLLEQLRGADASC